MKRLGLAAVVALLLMMTGTAGAQETLHTGTIVTYHLDSDVPGRGPCVQLEPPLPATWLCLYRPNPLYEDFRDALRSAYQLRSACVFGWKTVDAQGFHVLSLVECAR
jgi:hypothetical protein